MGNVFKRKICIEAYSHLIVNALTVVICYVKYDLFDADKVYHGIIVM